MVPPHRGPDVGFNKGREKGRSLGNLFGREKSPVVRGDLMHSKQVIGKYPRAFAKEHIGHEHSVSPKQHGSEDCGGGRCFLLWRRFCTRPGERVLRVTESLSYAHGKAGSGGCSSGRQGGQSKYLACMTRSEKDKGTGVEVTHSAGPCCEGVGLWESLGA